MLAGSPELDKDLNPYHLPENWLRDRKHCNLCDVKIESIRFAKIHFNSKLHRECAGLNVIPIQRQATPGFVSQGTHHCDICGFNTPTEDLMDQHKNGVRHLENLRTKAAVTEKGLSWKAHKPIPPQPPKFSVLAESLPTDNWG